MSDRQQFNVTLPPALVRRVKIAAIDGQLSASHLVEKLLTDHLTALEAPVTNMHLQPMIHVENMAAAVAFYEKLGATIVHGSRDGDFVMLALDRDRDRFSLLAHPPNPDQNEGIVELNFDTSAELVELERDFAQQGVEIAQSVTDEGFGRQLQLRSPDGLLIKINQLDPSLYS